MIQTGAEPKSNLLAKGTGYLFTGGTAAVVDLGLFLLISPHLSSIFLASIISFSLSAIVNYCLSGTFVFKKTISVRGFGKFYAFALLGMTINSLITASLVPVFGKFIAKVFAIGITFVFNFLMGHFVIFAK